MSDFDPLGWVIAAVFVLLLVGAGGGIRCEVRSGVTLERQIIQHQAGGRVAR